jgi:MYXO-CTERM domain-containing protein
MLVIGDPNLKGKSPGVLTLLGALIFVRRRRR